MEPARPRLGSWPVAQAPSPASQGLAPGAALCLEGRSFEVFAPIGTGSFGAVWGATCPNGPTVAVKEILCRTQQELDVARFEEHVLRTLGSEAANHENELCQIPSLVASETISLGPKGWRVRLAMT